MVWSGRRNRLRADETAGIVDGLDLSPSLLSTFGSLAKGAAGSGARSGLHRATFSSARWSSSDWQAPDRSIDSKRNKSVFKLLSGEAARPPHTHSHTLTHSCALGLLPPLALLRTVFAASLRSILGYSPPLPWTPPTVCSVGPEQPGPDVWLSRLFLPARLPSGVRSDTPPLSK